MKAWIENGIIRDIAHSEPIEIYHPDIAAFYNTDVPDNAQIGWQLIDDEWLPPLAISIVSEPVVPTRKLLSPIEFKLLFKAPERVAIYQSTDLIVKDFLSILDDTRLTQVDLSLQDNIDAIQYLVSIDLLTPERATEILRGLI